MLPHLGIQLGSLEPKGHQHFSYNTRHVPCSHHTINQWNFQGVEEELFTRKHPWKMIPHKSQWISKVLLYLVSQQNPFQIPANVPSHRWLPEPIPTAHPAFRRRRRGSSQAGCTLPAARTDRRRSAGSAPGSGPAAAWEVSFPAGSHLQVEETADVVTCLEVRMHACLLVHVNLPPKTFIFWQTFSVVP